MLFDREDEQMMLEEDVGGRVLLTTGPVKKRMLPGSNATTQLMSEYLDIKQAQHKVEQEIEEFLKNEAQTVDGRSKFIAEREPERLIQDADLEKLMDQMHLNMYQRIREGNEYASKVTLEVRKLHGTQRVVKEVIDILSQRIQMKECMQGLRLAMKSQQYSLAVKHIQTYRKKIAQYQTQIIPMDGTRVSLIALSPSDELYLESCEKDLKHIVFTSFKEGIDQQNYAKIQENIELLEPLGFASIGLEHLLSTILNGLRLHLEVYDEIVMETSSEQFMEQLIRLFNEIASVLNNNEPLLAHNFESIQGYAHVIHEVYKLCDQRVAALIARYIRTRGLSEYIQTQVQDYRKNMDVLSPRRRQNMRKQSNDELFSLEDVLNEMAQLIQHTQSYERFIRRKSREAVEINSTGDALYQLPLISEMDQAVQEVSGYYSSLENKFFNLSTMKALDLDAVENEVSFRSTSMDEIYFVLRNSGLRALATGHMESASSVMNYIASMLSSTLGEEFRERIKKMGKELKDSSAMKKQVTQQVTQQLARLSKNVPLSMAGIGVKDEGGAQESSKPMEFSVFSPPVLLNDLECCIQYTLQLREAFEKEIPEMFEDENIPSKLANALVGIEETAAEFNQLLKDTRALFVTYLLPRIQSFCLPLTATSKGPKTVSFELDESEFAQYEANDPFISNFVAQIDTLLLGIKNACSLSNYQALLRMVAKSTCNLLIKILLRHRFTLLGAMQLEKDLRHLQTYFVQQSEEQDTNLSNPNPVAMESFSFGVDEEDIRSIFGQINQISIVLNVEDPRDVMDYVGTRVRGMEWKLTPPQVQKILSLRSEFSLNAINQLQF